MDSSKSETKNPTGSETPSAENAPSLGEALSAAYDAQTAEPAVADETPPETEGASASDETEPEASSADLAPPEHWSAEDKESFLAMDESGRRWALRLEANAHKGIQAKSEELKRLRGPIDEFKHLFQGVDEAEGIRRLLNAQAVLQRNPVEGLRWLMQNLGVDEKQFIPSQKQPEDDDPFVDPAVKALKQEVQKLRADAENRQRNAQTAQYNAMVAEIQAFQNAADEQGNPLHPHAQQVMPTMAGLLQAGRATDLEDAYQKAVWALPEYREQALTQQVQEKLKEELAKTQKVADDAKKKAPVVNGRSSGKQAPKDATLRDSLSENYDKSMRGEL